MDAEKNLTSTPPVSRTVYCGVGSCDNTPGHDGIHRCRCGKPVDESANGCGWHRAQGTRSIGDNMSETARTWDIGDADPGTGVTSVATVEIDDEDCRPIHFGRTHSDDEWKGYDRGGKVYLSWAELVRRYGPIAEVS